MNVAILMLAIALTIWPSFSRPLLAESSQATAFETWLTDLRSEALAAGISEATVEAALGGITPIERVIELDRNQPEVRLDFWKYLNRIVSEERIKRGRRLLAENRALLKEVVARHGVPALVN